MFSSSRDSSPFTGVISLDKSVVLAITYTYPLSFTQLQATLLEQDGLDLPLMPSSSDCLSGPFPCLADELEEQAKALEDGWYVFISNYAPKKNRKPCVVVFSYAGVLALFQKAHLQLTSLFSKLLQVNFSSSASSLSNPSSHPHP